MSVHFSSKKRPDTNFWSPHRRTRWSHPILPHSAWSWADDFAVGISDCPYSVANSGRGPVSVRKPLGIHPPGRKAASLAGTPAGLVGARLATWDNFPQHSVLVARSWNWKQSIPRNARAMPHNPQANESRLRERPTQRPNLESMPTQGLNIKKASMPAANKFTQNQTHTLVSVRSPNKNPNQVSQANGEEIAKKDGGSPNGCRGRVETRVDSNRTNAKSTVSCDIA